MSASRQQRRASARDLDVRREALHRRLDATPVSGAAMDGAVILATEGLPAIVVRWSSVPSALALIGLALDGHTIADVEQVRAEGRVPLLTLLDGHVYVDSMRLHPLSLGGDA